MAPSLLKVSADFSTYPHRAGTMNGAIMQRLCGMAIASFAFSSLGGAPATARAGARRRIDYPRQAQSGQIWWRDDRRQRFADRRARRTANDLRPRVAVSAG